MIDFEDISQLANKRTCLCSCELKKAHRNISLFQKCHDPKAFCAVCGNARRASWRVRPGKSTYAVGVHILSTLHFSFLQTKADYTRCTYIHNFGPSNTSLHRCPLTLQRGGI